MRLIGSGARWSALLLCLLLGGPGCSAGDAGDGGDGGGNGDGNGDGNGSGDGGGGGDGTGDGDGGGDGGEVTCAAPADLGEPGALVDADADRRNQPGSMGQSQVYRMTARLTDGEPGDFLLVELWDGFGAFSGGTVRTGSFPISGADAVVESCGACVFVMADVNEGSGTPSQVYLAQSGTLVVDTVLPDLTGSLDGVDFQQIDMETDALMPEGCEAGLASATFDAPVTCFSGGGNGGGGNGGNGGGGEPVPCE